MTTTCTLPAPTFCGRPMIDHFHAAAFFRDRDEEYRVMVPFFQEALAAGEKVVNIVDPSRRAEHERRLTAAGLPVAERARLGQLELVEWADAYLKGGRFDAEVMLNILREVIATTRAQGFPRARYAGHMEWATTGAPGIEQLLDYEVRVDALLDEAKHPAVCMYDVRRHDPMTILDMLRAHRLVAIDGALRDNPFYVPPEELLRRRRAS